MPQVQAIIDSFLKKHSDRPISRIVALTGAGISAESGIPTFRGEEGYWTVDSQNYHPQEMATNAMFQRRPWDVWIWYLYRHFICRSAAPNPAHHSLAKLQNLFPGSVTLVTQNVDGLHLRAESPRANTYEIHGNIDFMRCFARCTDQLIAMPIPPQAREANQELSDHEKSALKCSSCDGIMRPHVLWFDECYEEGLFRSESSLQAAEEAELLLIIGTSGTTSLPVQIARIAALTKIPLVNINPQPNPFGDLADRIQNGISLQERAGDILPALTDALLRNQD